ncbi:MAG: TIGR00730 family Rossman fold protein [Rhizobiaceae bacterium]
MVTTIKNDRPPSPMTSSKIRSICVYCGSSPGNRPEYLAAAKTLGAAIGEHGLRLVYGGGTYGIMGAVADATLAAGGKVLGVIPQFLKNREASPDALAHLSELIVTEDMHERKHALFENSDAFVAMPGGIGTLEEIIEVMTWAQLGRHTKPIIFGNIAGFWDPLLQSLDHMRAEGFIHTANLVKPLVISEAREIVPAILALGHEQRSEGVHAIIEKL